MNKPKFIEKMIQLHNEKELNKPMYRLEDLYPLQIVKVQDREYNGLPRPICYIPRCELPSLYRHTYTIIKPFALFKPNDANTAFIHIISNHQLTEVPYTRRYEYAVASCEQLEDIEELTQQYLAINNLNKSSKLSVNQIKELERSINKKLAPDQTVTELFWGK